MRLVERVAGEGKDRVPQRLDGGFAEVVVQHALPEAGVGLFQLGQLLLTHGATQQVGLTQGVPGHLLRQLHDLLLVDDQAVGLREDLRERLLQLGVNRLDVFQGVLALGVRDVGVHTHRSRSIQRQGGDDVAESGGLHQFQQLAHTAAVELEHTESVAAGEQFVCCRIVHRQSVEVEVDAAVGFDVLERVADDREVSQTEEVHLEQADGFTRRVVPPGDDGAVLGALPDRDCVGERFGRHDDRAGVHTGVTDQPLQTHRSLVDLRDVRAGVDECSNLDGFLVPLVLRIGDTGDRDVLGHDGRRECLGDLIGDGEARLAELDASRVLDGSLGLDGAEGDDLGDLVVAPLVRRVANHLAATAIIEVDIDIGHGHTLGVEESLEQQPVRDGVDVGDTHRVGHQRTGSRSTAGPDTDPDVLGVVDQVADHEEVGREAHFVDDADLVVGAGEVLLRRSAREAAIESAHHLGAQEGLLRVSLRDREDRHAVVECPDVLVRLHTLADGNGVVACPRYLVVPDGAHLGSGLEVVAVAVELEASGVGERLAGLNAEQRLVILGGVLGDVMAVVGGKWRNTELLADVEQTLSHTALDRETVIHQFEEEVVRAPDLLPLRGSFESLAIVTETKAGLDLTGRATRGRDDALGVRGDELLVHPWPFTELALDGRERRQLEEVAESGRVLGHHRHVGVRTATGDVVGLLAAIAPQNSLGVEARLGCDVGLDADDRLDAGALCLVVELAGAVHVSVVGHADCGHFETSGLLEHGADLGRTVEHRVLGVIVKMYERVSHVRLSEGLGARSSVCRAADTTGDRRSGVAVRRLRSRDRNLGFGARPHRTPRTSTGDEGVCREDHQCSPDQNEADPP